MPGAARRGAPPLGWLASALLASQCAVAQGAAATLPACDYLVRAAAMLPPGPVLLPSYPSEHAGALSAVAFIYDNAVAAIALVGCGQIAPARRIGDALLLALEHDRYWHDGRLRNGYAAGPIRAEPVKLAGWWDRDSRRWLEDGYQAGSDSGNMAWAMLALLRLHAASGDLRYRDGALRVAHWVERMLDARGAGGFIGGYLGHEPAPQRQGWKSTEHNTDLAAAFALLARATGDAHWQQRAASAARFVAAMWGVECGCFAVGTAEDGVTVNPLLALDAQVWPLLALPGQLAQHAGALHTIDRLRFESGYTYSEAGGGLWTEGTAQVAVLLERLQQTVRAQALRAAVDTQRTPNGGYYASGPEATTTGFMLATNPAQPRMYLHLEHLGASAWVALAQLGYNPFTGGRSLPP